MRAARDPARLPPGGEKSGILAQRSPIALRTRTSEGFDLIQGLRGGAPQSRAFRDHYRELAALDVELFSLSIQPADYHGGMLRTQMSSMFGGKAETVASAIISSTNNRPGSFYPKLARPGKLCNSQAEKSWIDPVKNAIPVVTRRTPIMRSITPK